jgi:peptidoglycan-associated lipoprotein
MAHERGRKFLVAPLLLLALFLAGCPKRPATSVASAPAPAATPAPGPSAMTPATPAPAPAAPAPAAPAAPAPAAPARPAPAPAPVRPPAPAEFRDNANLQDIHFDFDKSDIRPGDAKILDGNAGWLKGNANQLVLIEGHCDERGTNEYNLALGERRAKSTMNYLVAQGVQANRITIISYGEERPLCTDKNETCWARNRRAHFLTKER